MTSIRPFHLAFPVANIKTTKKWYKEILGCIVGRESDSWVDLNLFGHQIVAHLVNENKQIKSNEVDGKEIPAFHFGVILEWKDWEILSERLVKIGVEFVVKPHIRFKGEIGEQATMFFKDPSGNHLEFKAFQSDDSIFAKSL